VGEGFRGVQIIFYSLIVALLVVSSDSFLRIGSFELAVFKVPMKPKLKFFFYF